MLTRDLIREYLASVGPRSRHEFSRLAYAHIEPAIGPISVELVAVRHVHEIHQKLKETPVQANRVLAVLSAAMRHAERLSLRPVGSNPCSVIRHFPEKKRRRYVRPEEAARIAAALRAEEVAHPREVLFLRLLQLTGARPDEIKRARWEDVRDNVLVLDVHKTDKTGDARRIYLPPAAMELLRGADRGTATITGDRNVKRLWSRVRHAAGCPDLRVYDLRHTFASVALKAGHSLGAIGELLGHRSAATTARYAHLMDGAARKMANEVGMTIAGMM